MEPTDWLVWMTLSHPSAPPVMQHVGDVRGWERRADLYSVRLWWRFCHCLASDLGNPFPSLGSVDSSRSFKTSF